jgi:hypothetical protein
VSDDESGSTASSNAPTAAVSSGSVSSGTVSSAPVSSTPVASTPVSSTSSPTSSPDASTGVLADDVLDGRYRLHKRVARRGPVALWRGDDLVLARPVAVRVLAHAESESNAGRLIAAAVRSGRLVHAGAASTYDATTTETASGTVAYVVSEWVDGSTLTALLDDAPLSPERAARVVLAVARVLVAAHGRDLTHGDLHPGDVVLTPHGGVKVLDIEVRAALTDEIAEAPSGERRLRDVRALGGLLYACLTGRWPLPGDRGLPAAPTTGDGALCTPRQVRAGVPRDLDGIVSRALAAGSDDENAFGTAAEVVDALESIPMGVGGEHTDPYGSSYGASLDGDPDPGGTTLVEPHLGGSLPRSRRRPRARRVVIPLVLLLVCGALAWLLGVSMGRLPGTSAKPPSTAPQTARPGPALTLSSVRAFDPEGDGTEQNSTVPLATDGDPATAWTTDTYRTSNFGNLKTGVGLLVDFGRPEKVSSVRLAFAQAGQSVELRAGDTQSDAVSGYPVVAQVVGAAKDVELTPTDSATHQYWVVWITQLPQTDRGFRAELDEMVFLS